ncbi:uncharacterized protein BYT42DRAFT_616121 [Radiomyces spectabilis]|uniref:uncharacterized protein n=1 Tax=Radiomyces spectabilis TaxID=64574 RepID=UPI00221FCD2D|nr:uncharacterized protein BYT42DRAFT_616121 [Radiomyces spectabilis]KAI8372923.1 hypothetical protein BYT42DRAFT_616121 [Radiomyces spectabilis]
MHQYLAYDHPPPSYQETMSTPADYDCWPSTYYGGKKRIDLAQFYHDVLLATQTRARRVGFSTEPPTVHVYEADTATDEDEDEYEWNKSNLNLDGLKTSHRHRRLDLRPIPNNDYVPPPKSKVVPTPPCPATGFKRDEIKFPVFEKKSKRPLKDPRAGLLKIWSRVPLPQWTKV